MTYPAFVDEVGTVDELDGYDDLVKAWGPRARKAAADARRKKSRRRARLVAAGVVATELGVVGAVVGGDELRRRRRARQVNRVHEQAHDSGSSWPGRSAAGFKDDLKRVYEERRTRRRPPGPPRKAIEPHRPGNDDMLNAFFRRRPR